MAARGVRPIKLVPAFSELEATAVSYAGGGRDLRATSGSIGTILLFFLDQAGAKATLK